MKFSILLTLALSYTTLSSAQNFRRDNADKAEQLQKEFAKLNKNSPCQDNTQACVEDQFAQCVGGKFQLNSCGGGELKCVALPLVNKPGTSITCSTEADRLARLADARGEPPPDQGKTPKGKNGKKAPDQGNGKNGKKAPDQGNGKNGKKAPDQGNGKNGKKAPDQGNGKNGKKAPDQGNGKNRKRSPDTVEDGKLPDNGKDGKLPDNGKDGKLPDNGKDGKLPDNGKDGKLPDNGKDGKLPDNGKDGKLPDNGKDGKLPKDGDNGKNGKLPNDGDNGKNGKLPKDGDNGKDGKLPGQDNGNEPPCNCKCPNNGNDGNDNGKDGNEPDNGKGPDNGKDNGKEPDNGKDNGKEPDNQTPPKNEDKLQTPPANGDGSLSAIQKKNIAAAKALQEKFDKLKPDDQCNNDEVACVDNKFAQCSGGKFALTDCAAGTVCSALPLVLKEGTTVACTTQADRDARLNPKK